METLVEKSKLNLPPDWESKKDEEKEKILKEQIPEGVEREGWGSFTRRWFLENAQSAINHSLQVNHINEELLFLVDKCLEDEKKGISLEKGLVMIEEVLYCVSARYDKDVSPAYSPGGEVTARGVMRDQLEKGVEVRKSLNEMRRYALDVIDQAPPSEAKESLKEKIDTNFVDYCKGRGLLGFGIDITLAPNSFRKILEDPKKREMLSNGRIGEIIEEVKENIDPKTRIDAAEQLAAKEAAGKQAAEQYAIDAELAKRLAELKGEEIENRASMKQEETENRASMKQEETENRASIEKDEFRNKFMVQFTEQQRENSSLNASAQPRHASPTGQPPEQPMEEKNQNLKVQKGRDFSPIIPLT